MSIFHVLLTLSTSKEKGEDFHLPSPVYLKRLTNRFFGFCKHTTFLSHHLTSSSIFKKGTLKTYVWDWNDPVLVVTVRIMKQSKNADSDNGINIEEPYWGPCKPCFVTVHATCKKQQVP